MFDPTTTTNYVHFSGPEHKQILIKFQDYVEAFWLIQAAERVILLQNEVVAANQKWHAAKQAYQRRSKLYRYFHPAPDMHQFFGNKPRHLAEAIDQQNELIDAYKQVEQALKEHDPATTFVFNSSTPSVCEYLMHGYKQCRQK